VYVTNTCDLFGSYFGLGYEVSAGTSTGNTLILVTTSDGFPTNIGFFTPGTGH